MNLILKICKNLIDYINIPKWKLVTRWEKKSQFKDLVDEFQKSDPFDAASAMLETLSCVKAPNQLGNIIYGPNYIAIINNEYGINVEYFPKSKRFIIIEKDLSYEIYKNTEPQKAVEEKWEIAKNIMIADYIEAIVNIIEIMHTGDGEKCKTILTNLLNLLS